ncbi:MAG: ATP-binding cassette domain-containing protein, partial [Kineosporiaceae bacterium]|nr:ATP-binding cassette domain-containing protein [Aeromicrobium sp.]
MRSPSARRSVSHADPADKPDTRRYEPVLGGARLDINELTWRPFGRDSPVLSGITLSAKPGERILLTGPSGSGKSTLLRAIAGVLMTVESGELGGSITVDSMDPHKGGASAGLLVQDPADAMVAGRVGREVAFGPENLGLAREEIWRRGQGSLDAVGFPYGVGHPVGAVSGGESQRLALAGVLALGPRLILLDEPTAMLDPAAAAKVRNAICAAVADTAATMIIVEHHFDNWLDKIDRVVVLSAAGVVVADGPVAETLVAHSETLAALGVWLPEVLAPEPLQLTNELVLAFDTAGGTGTPAVVAKNVTVNRVARIGFSTSATPASSVLSQVNAIARAGELVVLVGASGAGKSTLAALLAGLSAPSDGSVHAAGEWGADSSAQLCRWSSRDLASRVGWVPQQAEIAIVARTVWDEAMSTGRILDRDEQLATARVTGLLSALGLADLRDSDPHLLSGGELRRLALVGAIAHGPSVLVLDEPTVGQDRLTWAAVAGVITASRDAGLAVIVATHDPHLIQLADRVIRLEHGRVVEGPYGTPSVLAPSPPVSAMPVSVTVARPRGRSRGGLAARCGPVSLLGSSILLAIGALFITDVRVGAVALLVEALLAPIVFGWVRPSVRLLPGLLAVFSVGFSGWLLSPGHDVTVGVTACLRVAFFVLPGILLAGMSDPFALGDHLAQRLHFPPRPVVAAVAAMQRFETLGDQWQQLARTRRIRGLAGGRSPIARIQTVTALTFGLLLQSLRQAGRMAVAMESRGFSLPRASGVGRSWAEPAPWTGADSLLIVIGIVVAAIPAAI